MSHNQLLSCCCNDTPCCNPPAPRFLTLSFEGSLVGSGEECACFMDKTYTLVFEPREDALDFNKWTTIPRPPLRVSSPCEDGEAFPDGLWITLSCANDEDTTGTGPTVSGFSWALIFNPCNVLQNLPETPPLAGEVNSCDPFMLKFPLSNMEDCCNLDPEGEELLTIVITE